MLYQTQPHRKSRSLRQTMSARLENLAVPQISGFIWNCVRPKDINEERDVLVSAAMY